MNLVRIGSLAAASRNDSRATRFPALHPLQTRHWQGGSRQPNLRELALPLPIRVSVVFLV